MLKRLLSFILSLIIVFSAVQYVGAVDTENIEEKYLKVEVLGQSKTESYKVLLKDGTIYMSVDDLAKVSGYKCSSDYDIITFSRNDPYFSIGCWDEDNSDATVHEMGYDYNVKHFGFDNSEYYEMEKMLYLLHCQWTLDNNAILIKPFEDNILNFWWQNYEKIIDLNVDITDYMQNDESVAGYAFRTTMATILEDFDFRLMIPTNTGEFLYKKVLLGLLSENTDKFDDMFINTVNAIIDSLFLDDTLSEYSTYITALAESPKTFSEFVKAIPVLKFLQLDEADLKQYSNDFYWDEFEKANNIIDICQIVVSTKDVATRSKTWGNDFLDILNLLKDREGDNEAEKSISGAAKQLLSEKKSSIWSAFINAAVGTTEFLVNQAVEKSPAGKYLKLAQIVVAIAKSDPTIRSQIETAAEMSTADFFAQLQQFGCKLTSRYYSRIKDYEASRISYKSYSETPLESDSAFYMLKQPFQIVNDINYEKIMNGEYDRGYLKKFETALRLYLKSLVKCNEYAHSFYCNSNVNHSYDASRERELYNRHCEAQAYLIAFDEIAKNSTIDRLVLDKDFTNLYSSEYGNCREKIDLGILTNEDYSNLVTDAYSVDLTTTENIYNEKTKKSEKKKVTHSYRIPKINLKSDEIDTINDEIYNWLYPIIESCRQDLHDYSRVISSAEVYYKWEVNKGVLSLVVSNYSYPEYSGGYVYKVYNISINEKKLATNETVILIAGFTMDEYYERAEQALGSEYFQDKESYKEQAGYDDFFRTQLEKTLSEDNIKNCVPYFNANGQLCIIGAIYSLAGSDRYYHKINLESFVSNPEFNEYMKVQANAVNSDSFIERYKEILLRYPNTNTQYTLYDIDKNGTPELIVREDLWEYYIYSFNGKAVVPSDVCYWLYADCLYEYEGNGIVVHDGGMGRLHIEDASLYSMVNSKLECTERLMTTETCSFDELYSFLHSLIPINDFHPITDYSYLSN